MPPRPRALSIEERFVTDWVENVEPQMARALADELGPALDADPMSDAEALDFWDWADPKIDPATEYQKILAEAPMQQPAIPPEQVEQWAHATLATRQHPNRVPLIMMGLHPDDVDEQVKRANSYADRSARRKVKNLGNYDDAAPVDGTVVSASSQPSTNGAQPTMGGY